MKFTFRQLEYFIAAAEAGSITAASARVSISQPSISTAISHLERELGVQLFIRHHAQGLSLTPAGQALLSEAREVVRRAENLYSATADSGHGVRGVLSVGCMLTLAPIVMPELLQGFCREFPDAQVRQLEYHQEGLLEALRHGDIDLALTYDLELSSDVSFIPLVSLPPFAVFGADDPLRHKRAVTLRELAAHPLVLLDLPLSRGYFLGLFAAVNLSPRIQLRSPQVDVVRAMVAKGHGYTLLNAWPRCELALDGSPLFRVPVSGAQAPLVLGIASLKQLRRTRIAEVFETHCRTTITSARVPGMSLARARRPLATRSRASRAPRAGRGVSS